jgi:O-antigen ligase
MIAILLIAGIVGVVWAAVLLRHGDLIGGCLAVLLAGSVFGHSFYHVSVITADRLLIAGLIVAYLIYRQVGWADPKPLAKGDVAFLSFSGALALNTLAHNWRLDGAQPAALLLFFYLLPVAVYWIARQSRLDERACWSVFGFLGLFAVYLSVTGFAETRQLWSFVFPKYIATSSYQEFLGRGRGPFLNPIANGMFLCAGLFGVVQWWPHLNRLGRGVLIGVAVVICLGIYFTLTRSVWLGAGLGLLLIIWLAIPRSWRVPMVVAMALAGVPVLAMKWNKLNSFKRDANVSQHDMEQSAKLRPILATVAWKIFQDYPLFGCGFGQYKEVDVNYLDDRAGDLPLELARPYVQHNVFLALLTQTGLVGLGLWLMTLGLWARNAWRLWTSKQAPLWARQYGLVLIAMLIAYGVNGMFHDIGIITMVNTLLFLVAGVCQGLAPHIESSTFPQRQPAQQRLPAAIASGA